MNKTRFAAALAAAAVSLPASAATVVSSVTLDLTKGALSPTTFSAQTAAFSALNANLVEGDTWVFTADFLGNQQLTATGLSDAWLMSFADVASNVTATGKLEFLDISGNVIYTTNTKTDTEGGVHFGQYFASTSGDFPGLPTTLTFGGLRYTGTLTDFTTPGVVRNHYDDPNLYLNARNLVISTGVPEPATWAMMLLGFGAMGVAMRRKTNVQARIRFA